MSEKWTINDMSLPSRKYITIWADEVEVLVKQVEKGKAYALSQVPQTAKVAHLIAAAPDLLAACKWLAAWDGSADDAKMISEACSLARAAIRKAEGRP